ncbi:MAG: carbamoyltransferase HypF [Gammaproteobacteria bacterium]|nr:MAG: carbamoyltransferase HypF [Gammaproteobacteria bacterium]
MKTEKIIVRGLVQGVGFRPMVWHLAHALALQGDVSNNGDGVVIHVKGTADKINKLVQDILINKPPLARIDNIERKALSNTYPFFGSFIISASTMTGSNTGIIADAATCAACLNDVFDSNNHRYQYPFTNCTHCGPRLSIIRNIPYDREQTSMASFPLCERCEKEYNAENDRRFHAQPNACIECGPQCWLVNNLGKKISTITAINDVAQHLLAGKIVAIKGIGGFHLATLASDSTAVSRLRKRKRRPSKPFALMAKDSRMIEAYCLLTNDEKSLLESPAAPIVLLPKKKNKALANNIATNQNTLGFMLPNSPLHHLLLHYINEPIVLTSANISHEPPCVSNNNALSKLKNIADFFLLHNRDIENRVDDSVIMFMNATPQFLRRSRGYAPQSIILPSAFKDAPQILALGGELKNTFCLLKNGQATISQHMGDLENYATYCDFRHNLALYQRLFQHEAKHIAVDAHPEYISTKAGHEIALKQAVPLHTIQHHHAHIASCLAENSYPLHNKAVLGIVLDGLGYGEDNTLWGGEFLHADYQKSNRLAFFKPIALIGGSLAMKQPWRNLYAHLSACIGWTWGENRYHNLPFVNHLSKKPLKTLDAMLEKNINCPVASSVGRLFDAVAAAVGICFEEIEYEGQAAIALENKITQESWVNAQLQAYSFSMSQGIVDPSSMWKSLLKDISNAVSIADISAKFHKGLSLIVQEQACKLTKEHNIETIVLSGGVFQNKTLFEDVYNGLSNNGLHVLYHKNVPANDGGISLGQAVVVAARLIKNKSKG